MLTYLANESFFAFFSLPGDDSAGFSSGAVGGADGGGFAADAWDAGI